MTRAVCDNGGGVILLDIDRGSARAVTGVGGQPRGGPQVSLGQYGRRAGDRHAAALRALRVRHDDIGGDRRPESEILISQSGAARRVARFPLARQQETAAGFDWTASWVLTWQHRGGCTIRLQHGARRAMRVPCGRTGPAVAGGLWITNGKVRMLVDSRRDASADARARAAPWMTPLPGNLEPRASSATTADARNRARRPPRVRWRRRASATRRSRRRTGRSSPPSSATRPARRRRAGPPTRRGERLARHSSSGSFTHPPGFRCSGAGAAEHWLDLRRPAPDASPPAPHGPRRPAPRQSTPPIRAGGSAGSPVIASAAGVTGGRRRRPLALAAA